MTAQSSYWQRGCNDGYAMNPPILPPSQFGREAEGYQNGYAFGKAKRQRELDVPTLCVSVERDRVWINRGAQRFQLAYEADTDEERQWYAQVLRTALGIAGMPAPSMQGPASPPVATAAMLRAADAAFKEHDMHAAQVVYAAIWNAMYRAQKDSS